MRNLIGEHENRFLPSVFKKTSGIIKNGYLSMTSSIPWEELKVDLEGLSKEQLKLILRLVEQMKAVNKADGKAGNLNRRK